MTNLPTNPGLARRFPFKFRIDAYTADELKEILIREMERNPNDNEVTLQRTLDTFTGYQFASKFEKYQKILELNCPEESKRVNKQIALIIFGEIIEGS